MISNCLGFALWHLGIIKKERPISSEKIWQFEQYLKEVPAEEAEMIAIFLGDSCFHVVIVDRKKPGWILERMGYGTPIRSATFQEAVTEIYGYEGDGYTAFKYYQKSY